MAISRFTDVSIVYSCLSYTYSDNLDNLDLELEMIYSVHTKGSLYEYLNHLESLPKWRLIKLSWQKLRQKIW